jgi:hypothetical protein
MSQAKLQDLLEHQQQIKDWLKDVEHKILDLETSYILETPMGNILRGWEIDGKPLSSRPRTVDDKERLFSNSSYQAYIEGKSSIDDRGKKTESLVPPKKKARRSSSHKKDGIYDDWENDY